MYLTNTKIEENSAINFPLEEYHAGAAVLFLGKVRDHSQGKQVLYLEYEAYEAMAEQMIQELINKAKALWPVDQVRVQHRLGKVGLGEIAVLIEVQSAHRDEAYQASRFLIEEIKHKVPIWKKEYFADGTSAWGVCRHEPAGTMQPSKSAGAGC